MEITDSAEPAAKMPRMSLLDYEPRSKEPRSAAANLINAILLGFALLVGLWAFVVLVATVGSLLDRVP